MSSPYALDVRRRTERSTSCRCAPGRIGVEAQNGALGVELASDPSRLPPARVENPAGGADDLEQRRQLVLGPMGGSGAGERAVRANPPFGAPGQLVTDHRTPDGAVFGSVKP